MDFLHTPFCWYLAISNDRLSSTFDANNSRSLSQVPNWEVLSLSSYTLGSSWEPWQPESVCVCVCSVSEYWSLHSGEEVGPGLEAAYLSLFLASYLLYFFLSFFFVYILTRAEGSSGRQGKNGTDKRWLFSLSAFFCDCCCLFHLLGVLWLFPVRKTTTTQGSCPTGSTWFFSRCNLRGETLTLVKSKKRICIDWSIFSSLHWEMIDRYITLPRLIWSLPWRCLILSPHHRARDSRVRGEKYEKSTTFAAFDWFIQLAVGRRRRCCQRWRLIGW